MKQEEWSCWLVGMHTCTRVYTIHIHKSVCILNMLLHLVPCKNVMGMFVHMHGHVFVGDHMWFTVHLHTYMHMCSVLPFMFAHVNVFYVYPQHTTVHVVYMYVCAHGTCTCLFVYPQTCMYL